MLLILKIMLLSAMWLFVFSLLCPSKYKFIAKILIINCKIKYHIFINKCKIRYNDRKQARCTNKIVKLLIILSNSMAAAGNRDIDNLAIGYNLHVKKVIKSVENTRDKTFLNKLTMSFYDKHK